MSQDTRFGVSAEIASLVQSASAALAEGGDGQEALFELVEPSARVMTVAEAEAERKAGRPKGSQNRATKDFRAWLAAQGVDPGVTLATYLNISPEGLAERLGIKTVEAFDRMVRIAEVLLPYTRPKLAFVDDRGQAVPLFNLNLGGVIQADQAGLPPWEIAAKRREEYQQVTQSGAIPVAAQSAIEGEKP